jgi:hypothetical protein
MSLCVGDRPVCRSVRNFPTCIPDRVTNTRCCIDTIDPPDDEQIGRPKSRWEDDVKSDITKMKIANWRDCIKNRPKWTEFLEKAKTSLKL